MATPDFPVEIRSDTEGFTEKLRGKALGRLTDLKGDHTDIVSAAITIEEIAKGEEAFRYQFKVIAHMRPDPVIASKKADSVEAAMKSALDALERQVRERRDKLKEHWKRPDMQKGPEGPETSI